MAGLFSLWAAYQTDAFAGVAAASPSIWFPDFLQYMKEHDIRTESVYLSLGDREEKTRNPDGERICLGDEKLFCLYLIISVKMERWDVDEVGRRKNAVLLGKSEK